jgi:hypothetical protein|mmetsp:Transcript_2794/g.6026  ORF Transcript_2794/g.6026 Transcript_2794/m.6026 type:complete len:253 (-) Transcript_2794:113-871(-)|eukprot:CAMPEP_0181173424 /NCGR_PEP_ID=MMETSP1096-20121128/2992_1 /TAXON_ID=156174 ORGANISM="Chrysochromulina ericina, Strain CCMP281" /NCGR_SAMPLE_ID=MMETSP1096 /ASSEMBLY_ACC=CAM_ASM_000453 /LENGTH=252 /DNA_ID=CAMNT_0023261251 /DNA_START=15 /DNA_END=773 /DNA_ORIENTATION=+
MGFDITLVGFSETRQMAAAMLHLLSCSGDISKGGACTNNEQWSIKKNTTFYATCRNTLPISHHTCANNDSVAFAWESFAGISMRLESLLRAKNRTQSRQVLVYAVGTHYFAQFPDHRLDHWHNHTEAEYARAWVTQYYQDMQRLLAWLSNWRNRNVCVIWKTNNIGWSPHHTGHPSQSDGAHHHLNYWNIAMAEAAGLLVYDVEPLTLEQSTNLWRNSSYREQMIGAKQDFYHGYDHRVLAHALLSFIQTNC